MNMLTRVKSNDFIHESFKKSYTFNFSFVCAEQLHFVCAEQLHQDSFYRELTLSCHSIAISLFMWGAFGHEMSG